MPPALDASFGGACVLLFFDIEGCLELSPRWSAQKVYAQLSL